MSNEQTLKNVIEQMIDAYGLRERYEQTIVLEHWGEWMGKTIAKYTTDIYVKDGTLNVYISSSSLKQELNASTEKIQRLVNDKIGKNFIQKVVIR